MGRLFLNMAPDDFQAVVRGGRLSVRFETYEFVAEGISRQYVWRDVDLHAVRLVDVEWDHTSDSVDICFEGEDLPAWNRAGLPMTGDYAVEQPAAIVVARPTRRLDLEDGE